jgi:endonuclease/exonuclease/phosphatase family metal-dependent hydrolase
MFTVLNTHLDDQSEGQRKLAASMLLLRARYEAVNTSGPVSIIGDFNRYEISPSNIAANETSTYSSPPTGKDSGAYSIATGSLSPVHVNQTFANKYAVQDGQLPDFHMLDLRATTLRQNVSANYATFTDFTAPTDTSQWERIDFILGGSNLGW